MIISNIELFQAKLKIIVAEAPEEVSGCDLALLIAKLDGYNGDDTYFRRMYNLAMNSGGKK